MEDSPSVDVPVVVAADDGEERPKTGNQGNSLDNSDTNNEKLDGESLAEDVCPFVCGICSEKFSRVSAFYSHVKTHEFFSEKNKKNKILDALDVKEKVDDNVFTCGICQIEFPSMSLLHDHMVNEENTINYSYSNVDHTARPTGRTDYTSVNEESLEKETLPRVKSKRKKNVNDSANKKRTKDFPRSRIRQNETAEEKDDDTEDIDASPSKQGRAGRKKVDENTETSTPVKPIGGDGNSGAVDIPNIDNTMSPRRSGRQKNKVDYKALAGVDSAKQDQQSSNVDKTNKRKGITETTEQKDLAKNRQEKNLQKRQKTGSLDKSRIKKVVIPKGKDHPEENAKDKTGSVHDTDVMEDIQSKNEQNDILNKSETLEETDLEMNIKVDGTLESVIKIEPNDDEVNDEDYAEHDSDDDFEEYYDDEDPDYSPKLDADDADEENGEKGAKVGFRSRSVQMSAKILNRNKAFRKRSRAFYKNCLYPCKVCGRYFNKKALKKHVYAHLTVKDIQCDICGRYYKSKRHLTDHIRSVHKMTKYKCPICEHMLKGKQSIDQHVTSHILKKETTLALDDVPRIEVTEEEYMKWKEEVDAKFLKSDSSTTKNKKKKSKIANEDTETEGKFDIVDPKSLAEGPIHGDLVEVDAETVGTIHNQSCKVCGEQFKSHDMLVKHMLTHKEEEQYRCTICKAFFQTSEHLENHVTSVHGERDIACEICGALHRSQYALWVHKGKHLMKTDKYYSPEVVEKLQEEIQTRRQRKYKKDYKVYTPCHICGMDVLTARLKRHLEVHTTTKEWQCDVCKKFYKTRRYLIDHQNKTHKAVRMTCDICGQSFKGTTYLEIHKQTHGPRDKECSKCGKCFTTHGYLRIHMQTHEVKKKFKCTKCMAAFSHKQRFQIHMVEIHGEGPCRPCKYCGDLFPSRQRARQHERAVHEFHVKPARKKKIRHVHILPMSSGEILSSKGETRMIPMQFINKGVHIVEAPISKNHILKVVPVTGASSVLNDTVVKNVEAGPSVHQSRAVATNPGHIVKVGNREAIQVMIGKDGGKESLEYVELSQEEQDLIIQEAEASGTLTVPSGEETEATEDSVEQILEIPENAEQCQILLYPDGSFKLLNVVDKAD